MSFVATVGNYLTVILHRASVPDSMKASVFYTYDLF